MYSERRLNEKRIPLKRKEPESIAAVGLSEILYEYQATLISIKFLVLRKHYYLRS
jgi:hypothetical protein